MKQLCEGDLLWQPSPEIREQANLTHYMGWLSENRGQTFDSYHQLWQWSVDQVGDFWQSIWDYFDIVASQQPTTILQDSTMPNTEWFVDARLNYAENFFARMNHEQPAMLYKDERGPIQEISWQHIYDQSRALAQVLRELGVEKGDRVVAYMPNIPETFIALMAVTSIGAIWSSCSPDFGSRSVLDRFQQIEPKVLLAVNGYVYGGKEFDRQPEVVQLQTQLPTLEKTILVPLLENPMSLENTILWQDALATATADTPFIFEQLPFDHPLWVVYSSGTTGLPKPIVHGHGGVLLEHIKLITFHNDIKPSDRLFWYTSTGWMMWNYLMGGLLTGCTIIVYNGSPGYPDMDVLWQLAEETETTYFGTSAAYISACIKAEITPSASYDLSKIKALGSTGSPLTLDGFQWIYNNVNAHLALESTSGGTDLCTAFVGGCRLEPIYAGEIQGSALGAKIEAFDAAGQPVIDEVGELVITEPMPSMPVFFWNDPEMARYKASYFEMYPGIWRHGDWIKINERGGCVIYGRSDSTINRQGVRMGTSEIYQAVESLPEIMDSLIIDLEMLGRESYMPLFIVLRDGYELNEALIQQIKQKLREDISPRHVPNDIFVITEVPYTLSGKKMEVPIRRILLGHELEKAANPGAMRNPESLAYFIEFAKERLST